MTAPKPLDERLQDSGIMSDQYDRWITNLRDAGLSSISLIGAPSEPVSHARVRVDLELYAEYAGVAVNPYALEADINESTGSDVQFLYAPYTHLPRFLCTFGDRKALLYVTVKPNT